MKWSRSVVSDSLRPHGLRPEKSGDSDGKASAHNARDSGSSPGSGRSPGEGNSNPLQYSCLENSLDRGAWWATVPGVSKSQTRLSDFTFTFKVVYLQIIKLRCRHFSGCVLTLSLNALWLTFKENFQVWTETLEPNQGEWDSRVMLFDSPSSPLWHQSFKVTSCGARALACMLLKPASRIHNRSPRLCF